MARSHQIKTQLADGTYIDEAAGQVSFRAYAEDWRAARMHDPSTGERVEAMLRNHVYSYEGTPGRTHLLAFPSPGHIWGTCVLI